MPSAAPSFLLLRFLCRYKENEVAVGQTRRFCFCFWGYKIYKKSNRLTTCCSLFISNHRNKTKFCQQKGEPTNVSPPFSVHIFYILSNDMYLVCRVLPQESRHSQTVLWSTSSVALRVSPSANAPPFHQGSLAERRLHCRNRHHA